MTTIREVMTGDVVSVSPGLPLRDLVELLTREHISGAPVVDGGRVVGVVSGADVLAFLTTLPVRRSEDVEALERGEVEPGDRWNERDEEAAATFFVDTWDDAEGELSERFGSLRGTEWDVLADHTVEEAMSRRVLSIAPDAPVADAARQMDDQGVHRLLVMKDSALLGIVTTTDLSRSLGTPAEGSGGGAKAGGRPPSGPARTRRSRRPGR